MDPTVLARRRFLVVCAGLGVSGPLFPGALWALAQGKPKITRDMIDHAAALAGVSIADEHKEKMLRGLNDLAKSYDAVHDLHLDNQVQPALVFDPSAPGTKLDTTRRPLRLSRAPKVEAPRDLDAVAFLGVRRLAELVRTRKVSATALTEMYLARLERLDPQLRFVVTLTGERARAQAREADRDLAAGKYHGPLHGLPWGAKDLLAVKGYPTTWGAGGFEHQRFDEDATVVKRLDAAGAVLVAKLTLGALALGDQWFGGRTRNPWRVGQGSSGSSAGSAAAVAAGAVAFAIGSETLGSIASPSTRCGVTGLRPTFGRVPRTGAMALAFSMDKLGPICRSVEDCAIVLDAIVGPDGRDRSAREVAFGWDAGLDWRKLRIGYLAREFEPGPEPSPSPDEDAEARGRRERGRARRLGDLKSEMAALAKLRELGARLIAIELPKFPVQALTTILHAEAAAAFDELTRSGRDRLLTAQGESDWPNQFRVARFIPAVEYINAGRARTLLMEKMAALFREVDVFVAPTFGEQLTITNLTGHPAVILPIGFRDADAPAPLRPDESGGPGTPVSLTFVGDLFAEAKLLAVARGYQEATSYHLQQPQLGAMKS